MAKNLKKGSKVGIVCCSNGLEAYKKEQYESLLEVLQRIGMIPVSSDYIFAKKNDVRSGTAKQRADALMRFYQEREVDAVFDISGGDVAIEILPFLDFDVIADSDIAFWGYSDLTVILNAIYARTGKGSCLYQIRNLVRECGEEQIRRLKTELTGDGELDQFSCEFIQGGRMEGVAVGGNLRCLLKLAGSSYWPDMRGKILFLEGHSGGIPQLISLFGQLRIMGVFEQICGVLLGTFTQLEEEKKASLVPAILHEMIPDDLPVAVTKEIGHGADARSLWIGKKLSLSLY